MAIPVGGVERVEGREELEDLRSPYKADPQLIELGTRLFADYCVPCHGPEGRGMGKLAERFPPAPDLRHISICDRSDGFLYGTLTSGGRAMPMMREGLTTRQRWALVAFVRKLQTDGCTGSRAELVGEQRR